MFWVFSSSLVWAWQSLFLLINSVGGPGGRRGAVAVSFGSFLLPLPDTKKQFESNL